jgi:serine/threonine protein kinase
MDDLLHFSIQLAQAMRCLADNGITHRALACKNVLVFHNQQVKLAKLGRHVPEAETTDTSTDAAMPPQSSYLTRAAKLGIGSDLLRWMVSRRCGPSLVFLASTFVSVVWVLDCVPRQGVIAASRPLLLRSRFHLPSRRRPK